jgi:type IV pilus assembly protein PilC
VVIAISDFFVAYWWAIFGIIFGGLYASSKAGNARKSADGNGSMLLLRLPIFGDIIRKVSDRSLDTHAVHHVRCRRTLVESLESVGGAAGNHVYKVATRQIQGEVAPAPA